jgi:hypothetical protein
MPNTPQAVPRISHMHHGLLDTSRCFRGQHDLDTQLGAEEFSARLFSLGARGSVSSPRMSAEKNEWMARVVQARPGCQRASEA